MGLANLKNMPLVLCAYAIETHSAIGCWLVALRLTSLPPVFSWWVSWSGVYVRRHRRPDRPGLHRIVSSREMSWLILLFLEL
jgi:hypothetical protein